MQHQADKRLCTLAEAAHVISDNLLVHFFPHGILENVREHRTCSLLHTHAQDVSELTRGLILTEQLGLRSSFVKVVGEFCVVGWLNVLSPRQHKIWLPKRW